MVVRFVILKIMKSKTLHGGSDAMPSVYVSFLNKKAIRCKSYNVM